jgi:hypothetical protein
MPLASFTFLTPVGAIVVLAVALPLLGLAIANRRVAEVRSRIGLRAPHGVRVGAAIVALASVPVLLALAAMQPAVRTQEGARVRTDAEAIFVFDTSRSMLASAAPRRETRLQRAKALALRLRAAIPNVPSGVVTLTDRALPDLFPTEDAATFDSTVRDAVAIESPPPAQTDSVVTTLRPLADVATQGFFTPAVPRRVAIVLTDGEARPDTTPARQLLSEHVRVVFLHVWRPGERIFDKGGKVETAYRSDPNSGAVLHQLASSVDGQALEEPDVAQAVAAVRSSLGTGPTAERGVRPRTRPLAPYVAAAALVPLLLVVRRRNIL